MRVSNKFCEGNNRQQPERRPATAGLAQLTADAGDGGGVRWGGVSSHRGIALHSL